MKPYLENMNILDTRMFFFKLRSHMVHTVQMNFKRKEEYVPKEQKCISGEDDHQSHLTSSPSYQHLRQDLDLEGSDSDLVRFYQLVIREREEQE